MSIDWIHVQIGLVRKPEVVAIAMATGRSVHEVAGLLVDFWGWLSLHSCNGSVTLPRCSDVTLCSVVGGDVQFWAEVRNAGWLENNAGIITIPKWDRWNGSSAKTRLLNRERQERFRQKERKNPVTENKRKRNAPLLPEERRGDENTHPLTPSSEGECVCASASPKDGRTDEIETAWAKAIQRLPTHKPGGAKIGDPAAWIARVRRDNPGKAPKDIPGFEWAWQDIPTRQSIEELRAMYNRGLINDRTTSNDSTPA